MEQVTLSGSLYDTAWALQKSEMEEALCEQMACEGGLGEQDLRAGKQRGKIQKSAPWESEKRKRKRRGRGLNVHVFENIR